MSEQDSGWISQQSMAHLLRGELARSDTWRTRLDTTTNWALTTAAGVVSFAFSSPQASHIVLLVGIWLVLSFLMVEARRYRYFDLWNQRVRLLEGGYWAPLLRREPLDPDALRELAGELTRPQLRLSLFSAIATRIKRSYGPILLVLLATWFIKVYSHPKQVESWQEFVERAHVGPIPGEVIVVLMLLASIVFLLAVLVAIVARPPLGELRPHPRSGTLSLEAMFRPYAVPRRVRARGGR
jgi:uncharacterized membrane protein